MYKQVWHEQVQIAFVDRFLFSTILIFNLLNFKTEGSHQLVLLTLVFV